MPIASVTIRFKRSPAQESALQGLLTAQQDPTSSSYRQWLTPEQFNAQFGMAASDVGKVTAWLGAQGLTVIEVARGGGFVRFSGTAAQVEAALHTQLHTVRLNGETHFSNVAPPQLPTALAAVTAGVTGLDDFHLKPRQHVTIAAGDAASVSAQTAGQHTASPLATHPQYTSSASGENYLTPADFYTIYDETPLLSAGLNGTGITIAVVGQTDITLSDVANFRVQAGLSVNTPTVKLYGKDPGSASQDDYYESMTDLEWSGATAPAATVLFVNSTDAIDGSLTEAIDNNLAPIIADSYGDCEQDVGTTALLGYEQLVEQANAQGQTVVAAAGDDGATDCDYDAAAASQGLAVDFPASMPNVTGVGGTMFNEAGGTYWSATNTAGGGSALSYIPEAVWNESSSTDLAAGGGGASVYFTKPSWQVGTPADDSRDVPDVALNAGAAHVPYLICTQSFCTSGFRNYAGYLDANGGTSVSAQAFAGILAIAEQKAGARLGNLNPTIYALGTSTYAASVYHDIVVGNNDSNCYAGTPNCPASGVEGYSAAAGYDLASGWGSVDAFNFVSDFGLVSAPSGLDTRAASMTSVTATPASATAGTTITLTAAVASAQASTTTVPAGMVQFFVDNVATGNAVPLASGAAQYALATGSLTSGAHTITAAYSGSTIYMGSKGAVSLDIVSATAGDFSLTPATAAVAVKSGFAATPITFTVGALNGFTGTVTFNVTSTTSSLEATGFMKPQTVTLTASATGATSQLQLLAYVANARASHPMLSAAQSSALSSAKRQGGSSKLRLGYEGGVALAMLFVFVLPRRRRFGVLLAVLLTAGIFGVSGCTNGYLNNSNAQQNAAPGTYTVVVTATAQTATTTLIHSAQVTFTVQ
jgi:subtilase family serine protease